MKLNQHGLSTVFQYGRGGELLYERDTGGNTKEYVWLDGRPLARIDNDAQVYYYHVDHLGTPQAMTDTAGSTVWKADYEPFGKATIKVGTIENNLRFPGQYYDRETGLHYNYFRDCYDPSTGRYCQFDPSGLAGGLNLYLYANAAPTMYTDPLGLAPYNDPMNQIANRAAGLPPNANLPTPDIERLSTDSDYSSCVAKCTGFRQAVCGLIGVGAGGVGAVAGGIAGIPLAPVSGGATVVGSAAIGGAAFYYGAKSSCSSEMFNESCLEKCKEKQCPINPYGR